MNPNAIKELVRYYTRESGVRNLEREIGSVIRKVVRKALQKCGSEPSKMEFEAETITEKAVQKYLGARRYNIGLANHQHGNRPLYGPRMDRSGRGLARHRGHHAPGKGKVTCTGKLGEVMQSRPKPRYPMCAPALRR
jgi:ATP-dependent Lon protease